MAAYLANLILKVWAKHVLKLATEAFLAFVFGAWERLPEAFLVFAGVPIDACVPAFCGVAVLSAFTTSILAVTAFLRVSPEDTRAT